MENNTNPNNEEIKLRSGSFIVSKSDNQGRITYVNRVFMQYSGYREKELLGMQHRILRHPEMPEGIFHLLSGKMSKGEECFAYIKNLAKNGQSYWGLANITADFNARHEVIGYFSVLRAPTQGSINAISAIYQKMLEIERRAAPENACMASIDYLNHLIKESAHENYQTFVLSL